MTDTVKPPSILSPTMDTWLVGGFMSTLLILFLVLGSTVPANLVLWDSVVLTVLINGTHFMASYRLLYVSKEQVLRYKGAAIYLPIALAIYGVVALGAASHNPDSVWMVDAILVVTSLYLALHYTGQAWGMMASFAYLEKMPFEPSERRIFRVCLRILAVWQMFWAVSLLSKRPQFVDAVVAALMPFLHLAAVSTAVVGIFLFVRIGRRAGRIVPARIWLPYFSLHVWYAFLWVYPQSLFWVQIAHSLQYLSFPARVEMNRISAVHAVGDSRKEMLKYVNAMLITSCIVFGLTPWAMGASLQGTASYWAVLASIVNIHHYYIDGCVWHIGNPTVRKALFSHLDRGATTAGTVKPDVVQDRL